MHPTTTTRTLSDRSGEELLIMAIAGDTDLRRRIHTELNLRALLAEGPRRARRVAAPPSAPPLAFSGRAA